jgi:hypothetical protein
MRAIAFPLSLYRATSNLCLLNLPINCVGDQDRSEGYRKVPGATFLSPTPDSTPHAATQGISDSLLPGEGKIAQSLGMARAAYIAVA